MNHTIPSCPACRKPHEVTLRPYTPPMSRDGNPLNSFTHIWQCPSTNATTYTTLNMEISHVNQSPAPAKPELNLTPFKTFFESHSDDVIHIARKPEPKPPANLAEFLALKEDHKLIRTARLKLKKDIGGAKTSILAFKKAVEACAQPRFDLLETREKILATLIADWNDSEAKKQAEAAKAEIQLFKIRIEQLEKLGATSSGETIQIGTAFRAWHDIKIMSPEAWDTTVAEFQAAAKVAAAKAAEAATALAENERLKREAQARETAAAKARETARLAKIAQLEKWKQTQEAPVGEYEWVGWKLDWVIPEGETVHRWVASPEFGPKVTPQPVQPTAPPADKTKEQKALERSNALRTPEGKLGYSAAMADVYTDISKILKPLTPDSPGYTEITAFSKQLKEIIITRVNAADKIPNK